MIVHAGRQDVAIMRRTWDTDVTTVFDTQVAAGFLGFGNQEGYERWCGACWACSCAAARGSPAGTSGR